MFQIFCFKSLFTNFFNIYKVAVLLNITSYCLFLPKKLKHCCASGKLWHTNCSTSSRMNTTRTLDPSQRMLSQSHKWLWTVSEFQACRNSTLWCFFMVNRTSSLSFPLTGILHTWSTRALLISKTRAKVHWWSWNSSWLKKIQRNLRL